MQYVHTIELEPEKHLRREGLPGPFKSKKVGQTIDEPTSGHSKISLFTWVWRNLIVIVTSNMVWYSWFCSEGPINAPNSIFLGFNFVPRDLDSRRHMGPQLAGQGTLTRGAGDLDSQRHGTLTQIYGAASQGPLRCELRSPVPRVEVPCGAGSRGPWGQNKKTNFLSLRCLEAPPGKITNTTPHYYSKYEIWPKIKKLWTIPSIEC